MVFIAFTSWEKLLSSFGARYLWIALYIVSMFPIALLLVVPLGLTVSFSEYRLLACIFSIGLWAFAPTIESVYFSSKYLIRTGSMEALSVFIKGITDFKICIWLLV
jgi:hypothetical protein